MKYRLFDGYEFKVLDKFNIEDEVERLDAMMDFRDKMLAKYGDDFKSLWIKNTVIIQPLQNKV